MPLIDLVSLMTISSPRFVAGVPLTKAVTELLSTVKTVYFAPATLKVSPIFTSAPVPKR